jgi:hypothetical protein
MYSLTSQSRRCSTQDLLTIAQNRGIDQYDS